MPNDKLHIVAVVAVIKNSEGKFLVLKRRDDEIAYPGLYTFPGGKMEGDETVEEALAREALEEAGLRLLPGKILLKDKSVIRPDGQSAKFFSYLCWAEHYNVTISKDFTDFAWVSVEELRDMPHVGIEEELVKADAIINSGVDLNLFQTKSVKEDLFNN